MLSKKQTTSNSPLVFFGTGSTSLEALQCLSEVFEIELIVTKPPALNSAGKHFKNSVHQWGEKNSIPIIVPKSQSELAKLISSRVLKSKLGIVLDFGMIIPARVIDAFGSGILNSHFSLLPRHRGANPIRTAILRGDLKTGVTIIKITPGLDDGPILAWAEFDIDNLNAAILREELSKLNCALLPETAKMYLNGQLDLINQDQSGITHTTKTTKQNGRLDFNKTAEVLAREIRAYSGWPKSYFNDNGQTYIVIDAKASAEVTPQGKLTAKNKCLHIGCKLGSLQITSIQPAGKPAMEATSFINGYLK